MKLSLLLCFYLPRANSAYHDLSNTKLVPRNKMSAATVPYAFSFTDHGTAMPEETQAHIFMSTCTSLDTCITGESSVMYKK